LLPFGGFKGSAISVLIDLIAGQLAGARSGPEIVPLYERLGEPQGIGQLFVALNIDAFDTLEAFTGRVDQTVRKIRLLPTAAGASSVVLPGELEHLRAQDHLAHGIPLPSDAVAEVARTATLLGLDAPRPG